MSAPAAKRAAAVRSAPPSAWRALLGDAALIATVHAALCLVARRAGFDHVSDDDFSRVTIAQSFAHAPKLDPSGTSWLPFPFWVLGSMLAVCGRSLAAARVCSVLLSSVGAALPYLALRYSAVPRIRALVATAFAFMTPWCIWLGATTVPESFTASLIAAGAIGTGAVGSETARDDLIGHRRAPLFFALGVAAACLSRYEAWPAAAVMGVALLAATAKQRESARPLAIGALLCTLGPLAWMAWNGYAHDGPLHFFHRVASYKQGIGEGASSTWSAVLLYPSLLFGTRPEVTIPALFLLPALRDRDTRQRWGIPLLCALAQVVFLAYGNVRDGAPTHHPDRALIGTMHILALFVADVGTTKLVDLASSGRRTTLLGTAGIFAFAWVISSVRGATPPGHSVMEDRSVQIARGEALREKNVSGLDVTPCAFEHFALIAAFGAPERVDIKTRTTPALRECPDVQTR